MLLRSGLITDRRDEAAESSMEDDLSMRVHLGSSHDTSVSTVSSPQPSISPVPGPGPSATNPAVQNYNSGQEGIHDEGPSQYVHPREGHHAGQEQQAWLPRDTSCSPRQLSAQSHGLSSPHNPEVYPPQDSYFLPRPPSHYGNGNGNGNSHGLNPPYPPRITTSPGPETGSIHRYTHETAQWSPVLDPTDDAEHQRRISAMPELEQFHPLQQPPSPDKLRRELNRIEKRPANQDEDDEDEGGTSEDEKSRKKRIKKGKRKAVSPQSSQSPPFRKHKNHRKDGGSGSGTGRAARAIRD